MDDGSPEFDINGDSLAALNYNSIANTDDGSCIAMVFGCMNPSAMNYNPQANVNDSSCDHMFMDVLMKMLSILMKMQILMMALVLKKFSVV